MGDKGARPLQQHTDAHFHPTSLTMGVSFDEERKEPIVVHHAIDSEEYQEYLVLKDTFQGERLSKLTVSCRDGFANMAA